MNGLGAFEKYFFLQMGPIFGHFWRTFMYTQCIDSTWLTQIHFKSCFITSSLQIQALCDFSKSLKEFWVTESIWGCIGTFGHQPFYWRIRPEIDSLMFLRVKLIFESVRTILDPINQWIIVKTNWVGYSEARKAEKIITQCPGGASRTSKMPLVRL